MKKIIATNNRKETLHNTKWSKISSTEEWDRIIRLKCEQLKDIFANIFNIPLSQKREPLLSKECHHNTSVQEAKSILHE